MITFWEGNFCRLLLPTVSMYLLSQRLSSAYLPLVSVRNRVFSPSSTLFFSSTDQTTTKSAGPPTSSCSTAETWVNWGLFISSFKEGLSQSPEGRNILKQGLGAALLREQQKKSESSVKESVLASPCNGPNMDALDAMESLDHAIAKVRENVGHVDHYLRAKEAKDIKTIRLLYIPTALYSIRPESSSSPGRQRSRARYDGKQRRKEIVRVMKEELFVEHCLEVHSATLDLDDGSIKQQDGSSDPNDFPKDGKEALNEWKPHLVYVEGGNTFWLYHCLEKGNWQSDLINCITGLDSAVYIGNSAGAILAGETVSTATWKQLDNPVVVPGKENYDAWKGVSGLKLAGGHSFFPHMRKKWEDVVAANKEELESQVVCLADEDVCFVNGKENTLKMVD